MPQSSYFLFIYLGKSSIYFPSAVTKISVRYEQGIAHYTKGLHSLVQTFGSENHPDVARIKADLAWIFFRQGKYDQAETFYREALQVRESFFSTAHPEVARSLHDLAELCQKLNRLDEAEALHLRALRIRGKSLKSSLKIFCVAYLSLF
jgi:tetratricopeptide (TPR) repeat protein